MALSRPAPGPLIFTSSSRTPNLAAFSAHASAAFCAANGVDLRDPLYPIVPDEAQQRVSPPGSEIVMIVLIETRLDVADAGHELLGLAGPLLRGRFLRALRGLGALGGLRGLRRFRGGRSRGFLVPSLRPRDLL